MPHLRLLLLVALAVSACGPERRPTDRNDDPAQCGNNLREPGEACDGTDLVDTTCESLGKTPGTLRCLSDCSGFDTTFCAGDVCVPDCSGLACGQDPVCNTPCGTCDAGEICNAGQCKTDTCVPDCTGLACGVDPVCGTSCGTCEGTDTCNAGRCEACVPDCSGRTCGVDPVCGTSCGTCGEDEACTGGQCQCVPDCSGRTCGPDPICGTSCGTCSGSLSCGADGTCQSGCTSDAACGGGWCHPQKRVCVPAGQKRVCDPCSADSECGLEGDECLRFTVTTTGALVEQVCGTACLTSADCLKGYSCSGGQCYPVQGLANDHTCQAVRDFQTAKTCVPFSDMCGVSGFDDGTCAGSTCTIGCVNDDDCPGRATCTFRNFAWFCTHF